MLLSEENQKPRYCAAEAGDGWEVTKASRALQNGRGLLVSGCTSVELAHVYRTGVHSCLLGNGFESMKALFRERKAVVG